MFGRRRVWEQDWLFQMLQQWQSRVGEPGSNQVHPGSSLASESDPVSGISMAAAIWRPLARAGEEFIYVASVIDATRGGAFSRPYYVGARAALLGAARAMWLLEPESADERHVRCLRLLNNEADDVLRLVKGLREDWPEAERSELRSLETESQTLAKSVGDALSAAGHNPKSGIKETEVIRAVAPLLGNGMDKPVEATMHLWRVSSGLAHARIWAFDADPGRHAQESTQLAWSIPAGLAEHAWGRWLTLSGNV